VVKWSGRAMRPDEVPGLVAEAVGRMSAGRPRPVEIEIPPDVLEASFAPDPPGRVAPWPAQPAPDPAGLEEMAPILAGAVRPLILAGGGMLAASAWNELRAVAECLEAPVLMTANAKGALSSRHRLACDGLTARRLLDGADVILAVGTRFTRLGGGPWRLRPEQVLLRIDADPAELSRDGPPRVAVEADARTALAALASLLPADNSGGWHELEEIRREAEAAASSLQPQAAYGAVLRDELSDDTIVIPGMTQLGYWSRVGFPVYEPRTYLTSGYQGTLGFELPTGLGAQAGQPERRVVILVGDGGFLFNVQELATAAQHGLPAISVVFDDGGFGNVRRIQRQRFGREIASELRNPDFVRLAESFGVSGIPADGPEGLRVALRRALAEPGPAVIVVKVGEMADPWPLLLGAAA
ncbi:MAG: thiamine pyrophosphate-dependent enzyme, partial [Candidatus Dormibacteraeota bacterium]|nr:thiamine pyrophosphate-dependent enzyme [Candidatus Dormibacteraeota bacterium]